MSAVSTYIQCPECEQFIARNTFNAATGNYKCPQCGPFSKVRYIESKHKLICHEFSYGEKGTDIPFDKKAVKALPMAALENFDPKDTKPGEVIFVDDAHACRVFPLFQESYQETAERLGVPEAIVRIANEMVLRNL